MSFRIDRRPIKCIRPWAGFWDHPRGMHRDFRAPDDYVENLFAELEAAYIKGFRRFCIMLPAGKPHGQRHHGNYHWWALPDAVRSALVATIPSWLADRPDALLFPYISFLLGHPAAFHQRTGVDTVSPDPANSQHREWMAWSTEPWLSLSPTPREQQDGTALRDYQVGIGFDASARVEHRHLWLQWFREFEARRIWVIGEGIPVGTDGMPAREATQARHWALVRFLNHHDPDGDWTFDPNSTENAVLIGGDETQLTIAEAEAWVSRGFVLASMLDKHDAAILSASSL